MQVVELFTHNGISPIKRTIAWLEFELAYHDVAIQHFSRYIRKTPQIVT